MTQQRTHRYLALFAAGLAMPAGGVAANTGAAAPHACPGDTAMASDKPGVTIDTSGSGHSRMIVQTDADGTVRLGQHGTDHSAVAVQQGSGGSLAIEQSGASARADVVQGGTCNAADLSQAGAGNRATITQSGNGNRVVVRQGPAKGDSQ